MKCEGTVVEGGDIAVVRMESMACDHCQACGFGAVRDRKSLEVNALNDLGARKGDRVFLEVSGKVVMGASAIVFLVPFAGFVVGLLIGFGLGALLDISGAALGLIIGFALMAASYYLVYLLGRRQKFEFIIKGPAD
ncbi:MAG: SoxR reducing system RseC family protein [Actinomycetota bacterium]